MKVMHVDTILAAEQVFMEKAMPPTPSSDPNVPRRRVFHKKIWRRPKGLQKTMFNSRPFRDWAFQPEQGRLLAKFLIKAYRNPQAARDWIDKGEYEDSSGVEWLDTGLKVGALGLAAAGLGRSYLQGKETRELTKKLQEKTESPPQKPLLMTTQQDQLEDVLDRVIARIKNQQYISAAVKLQEIGVQLGNTEVPSKVSILVNELKSQAPIVQQTGEDFVSFFMRKQAIEEHYTRRVSELLEEVARIKAGTQVGPDIATP